MSISIIIPQTKEYLPFFPKAIESIQEQKREAEIIVINADNISVGEATNKGVGASKADYVMRLDCDDYLHPYATQVMANYLDVHLNISAVYSDYWHANEHGHASMVGQQTDPPHPGCMMIRRSAYNEIKGFDETLTRQEGTDFFYRLTKHHKVEHIPLPLWYYRRHKSQMSNAHNEVVRARHEITQMHEKGGDKILAIIPARGGSKGIPRKNLVQLNGLPLVVHAIRRAKKSRLAPLVVVSTEDEEIASVAQVEGVEVIKRAPEDAQDEVDLITVAKHVMEDIDATYRADIIVTIQPTAPWTPVEALDNALSRMLETPNLDAVVAMSEVIGKHPYRLYSQLEPNIFRPFFPNKAEKYLQRQDRPKAFQFTGGFYCRRRHLLEAWNGEGFALGRWEGEIVPPKAGIDIDTRFDLFLAEAVKEHWSEL